MRDALAELLRDADYEVEAVSGGVEALQAIVWHLIVSHPKLKLNETKWESVAAAV